MFRLQWMAASVCGPHGQRAVRRVGLVPSQEKDHVTTLPLLVGDKTALVTSVRPRVASLRHVLEGKTETFVLIRCVF